MQVNNFKRALEKKLIQSQYNNFGVDNYDEYRFGEFPTVNVARRSIIFRIKNEIKKIIRYKTSQIINTHNDFLTKYEDRLQKIYEQVNAEGQSLLVDIIAYRLLGYKKVKLPRNNKEYWDKIEIANSLADNNDTYDPHFLHFILQKCYLRKIGYEILLYFSGAGVAIDFIFEQYAYKSGSETIIAVEKGDVVLDLGACWGDTALYFACKTGEQGKVYSFEFIPDNIKLFNINISLNPNLIKQIELIQHPVSNKSDNKIYFIDNGPGSRIEFEPITGQTGQATTISIDDFVNNNSITKVDFIKMDIEGAETLALDGAIETIKRFKPKLAIAIYHNMDDFVNIPNWIEELNMGYKLYLGHYTIHSEETVIYAKVEL
jgi:FkbM family methyltransferase